MKGLSLTALAISAANANCSTDWHFQQGNSYEYDLLATNSGNIGHQPSGKTSYPTMWSYSYWFHLASEGTLVIDMMKDCTGRATIEQGRDRIEAYFSSHEGSFENYFFKQDSTVEEKNLMKSTLSSLQINQNGFLNKGYQIEQISSGRLDQMWI